jgi:NitT/TauT family transport system substrate-binding protein
MRQSRLLSGRHDIASEVVKGARHNAWHTFEPEDALRRHALRLREVARSTPQKIISHGTDWRLLNEPKKALKA